MSSSHWDRQFLISKVSIGVIRSELAHIKRNTISTPDTETSFKNIVIILDIIEGV